MRSTGVLDSARGLGRHDHICWGYDDPAEFRSEAERFALDGLRLGQRVLYTAAAASEVLAHDLAGIPDLDHLLAVGAVEVVPIDATYAARHGGDADQAEAYASATNEALAAGYTGLRTVADATVLVLDPDDRDRFVRYEHRIDRRMADGLPFSAMCAYDRTRLDPGAVDELACVHPLVHGAKVPFRLHASPTGALELAGDIDAWHHDAVRMAFDRVLSAGAPSVVTIDCTSLAFIHHRGLMAMDAAATSHDVDLHLIGTPPVVRQVCDILSLGAVHPSQS